MIYTIHTIDEQTFSMVRYAVANSPYTLRQESRSFWSEYDRDLVGCVLLKNSDLT